MRYIELFERKNDSIGDYVYFTGGSPFPNFGKVINVYKYNRVTEFQIETYYTDSDKTTTLWCRRDDIKRKLYKSEIKEFVEEFEMKKNIEKYNL